MKIKILLFRFIFFSLVIFLLWIYLGKLYLFVLAYVSKYLLLAMGYNLKLVTTGESPVFIYNGAEIGMKGAHLSNFNILPLVSLVLAVPGIALKRRGKMLLIGIAAIFLLHLTDFAAHIPMYSAMYYGGSKIAGEAAGMIVNFMAVGEVAVPFLIWFALAYKEIFPEVNGKMSKENSRK